MAKVSFTAITPLKSKEDITIMFKDKEIVIKQYLSIKDKAELVDYIIQSSFDSNGLFSPIRQRIYTVIGLLRWYTNINFTETMLENIEKTFDLISLNNITDIINSIPQEEYNYINNMIIEAIIETKEYARSFAGQVQYIKSDYRDTDMDLTNIAQILQDPNQIGLVKEIMDKMG